MTHKEMGNKENKKEHEGIEKKAYERLKRRKLGGEKHKLVENRGRDIRLHRSSGRDEKRKKRETKDTKN
jgi:hypothetical protein